MAGSAHPFGAATPEPAYSVVKRTTSLALTTSFQTLFDVQVSAPSSITEASWWIGYSAGAATSAETRITITDDASGTSTFTLAGSHNGADVHAGNILGMIAGSGSNITKAFSTDFATGKRVQRVLVEVRSPSGSFSPVVSSAIIAYKAR